MQLQINLSAIETLKNTELPDLLTVRQVGEILGISRVSVCKQISSGKLIAVQKGRIYHIPKSAVIGFLRNREENHK